MKTKINHILPVLLLTAASGLTTVSCNDFLDKTPDNRTELNTDQKIAKLLVSAYPDVSPNELFELYSDNSDDSGPTYGYYQLSEKECYNWEDTKEEYQDTPNSLWGGYYGAISAANMALKAIEEKGNPASLNPQRGEALVCRAYCHFMLATIFCNAYDTHASESLGIPYMEDVETTVSPRYERGTLEEVYRKVERDLLEGVELISDDGYSVPKYHFTRKAAYAFAARFYLYYMKPDFSNCDRVIDFATRVLGSNPDDLLRDWEALSNLSVNGNVQADAYIASSNEANLLISSTVSNWVELGLQTIHEHTLRFIRSGFSLAQYEQAVSALHARGIKVITHLILGLPGETTDDMRASVRYLAAHPVFGVKLQLLHVLEGTDLGTLYKNDPFPLFTLEEYCDLIADCLALLPPEMVIHRLTGDGPRRLLLAPQWSTDKKRVLNTIHRQLAGRDLWQGKYYRNEEFHG